MLEAAIVIRHDVHIHYARAEREQLDRIEAALAKLTLQGTTMSKELDAIAAEVARNTTLEGSTVLLLDRMAEQISQLKNDPAKLQAFADSLRANNDKLAAALAQNTPVDSGAGTTVQPTGTADTGAQGAQGPQASDAGATASAPGAQADQGAPGAQADAGATDAGAGTADAGTPDASGAPTP
jgi:hypothetical protein